ncbi:MAG: hypothetical protein IKK39_07315, partial [Thermoguttaceae bacterium]|nr:hypothetical protein [Thermoguttaceae bacterium]
GTLEPFYFTGETPFGKAGRRNRRRTSNESGAEPGTKTKDKMRPLGKLAKRAPRRKERFVKMFRFFNVFLPESWKSRRENA